jgi:phospholipase/carboxylesterase
MHVHRTKLAGLDCAVLDDLPRGAAADLAVVLCHGFGAPGEDLVALGPEILAHAPALRARARFYFPAAPLVLGGPFLGDARAWWEIDIERFNRAVMTRDYSDLRREEPAGLATARAQLQTFLSALEHPRLALGGFSQGAMLATDVTLRLDHNPTALAIFSGTLLIEDQWRPLAASHRGLRVVQSHGQHDPLLPFRMAEELKDLLTQAGASVEFIPFPGEHSIPQNALKRFAALLNV